MMFSLSKVKRDKMEIKPLQIGQTPTNPISWDFFNKWPSIIQVNLSNSFLYDLSCAQSFQFFETFQTNVIKGSDCGSVGRAVASDTRGQWFESNHWQIFN